jgi:hypothetical protein
MIDSKKSQDFSGLNRAIQDFPHFGGKKPYL